MILYHGIKDSDIKEFLLFNKRKNLDFGSGFYLTTQLSQEKKWAGEKGAVYKFDIDIKSLKVVEYKDDDLNFVFYLCRIDLEDIAKDLIEGFKDADIIMGKMLDGSVIQFEKNAEKTNAGDISYEEFSDKIKLFYDKDQICFKTQRVMDLLNKSYIGKI